MSKFVRIALLACATLLVATSASGHETRAGVARDDGEKKSKDLHPYAPGRVETTLYRIENRYLMERRFTLPRGIFLRLRGTPQGAGMAFGPAYRQSNNFYNFTATSAVSMRKYWELTASFTLPHLAND